MEHLPMTENTQIDAYTIQGLFDLHRGRCIGDIVGRSPFSNTKHRRFHVDIDDPVARKALTEALENAGLSHYYSDNDQRVEVGHALTGLYAYNKKHLQELLDQ